ncbi:MAG: hypothetical protein ACR2KK_13335 [Acidimicrobiales bacterium]
MSTRIDHIADLDAVERCLAGSARSQRGDPRNAPNTARGMAHRGFLSDDDVVLTGMAEGAAIPNPLCGVPAG